MRNYLLSLTLLFVFASLLKAQEGRTITDKTKINGGLCLIIGAKDTKLTEDLINNSSLFVQALQPDIKTVSKWRKHFSDLESRKNFSIRESKLNTIHYGSDLFNLIIFETKASINKSTLEEINRILVPDGVVIYKEAPTSYEATAKTLNMTLVTVEKYQKGYRKNNAPRQLAPTTMTKWRAGARAHWSGGWSNHGYSAGVFYYTEKLEVVANGNFQ